MIPLATLGTDGANGGTGIDPRLKPAAHEFEACLMKEFLEPLQRDPLFEEGQDGSGGDSSGNALMSFGSEALARAISERGGFGIADRIIHQLEEKAQARGVAPAESQGEKKTSSVLGLRR